jgi:two-component system, cell cycle sensor histidine kinase and response regulator CckA
MISVSTGRNDAGGLRGFEERAQRSDERTIGPVSMGPGVITLDALGYVTGWNAAAERITGFDADEIVGKDLSAIYTAESLDADEHHHALQAAISQGIYEEESWKRRKDGSRFWCHLSVNAVFDRERTIEGFAVVLSDLTQQRAGLEAARRTEDLLRQSQRMEAIGRLAGGIAHDFNNLLTAIQGHAQFLLDDLPEDHPSQQDALEIRRSADRAAALTRQLLAFSRRQELQSRVLNINDVIEDMRTLLRRVISEDIELQINLQPDIWMVRADPGQLEQVLMNLVVNARDAMPRGGAITIRTINTELDESYTEKKLDVAAGPYVQLTVSDTGVGMDRETQAHVFEPFFTTKPPGKGTGLGLATVYGIVKQSGGHVWVYSEPNQGTTFKIYLPRTAGPGELLHRTPKLRDLARPGETVLVVEDEGAVRQLAKRVLEQRGYHVLEAATGADAERIASDRMGPIHLLLSDVIVTDSNGRKIADQILASRPDMKVVFMSGYTDEDVRQHGVLDSNSPFLEKPFTPDLLARKVREALDTPA